MLFENILADFGHIIIVWQYSSNLHVAICTLIVSKYIAKLLYWSSVSVYLSVSMSVRDDFIVQ